MWENGISYRALAQGQSESVGASFYARRIISFFFSYATLYDSGASSSLCIVLSKHCDCALVTISIKVLYEITHFYYVNIVKYKSPMQRTTQTIPLLTVSGVPLKTSDASLGILAPKYAPTSFVIIGVVSSNSNNMSNFCTEM